jgi:hypothetical protein
MPFFGGQLGKAEKEIGGRKSRLDAEEEKANNPAPKETKKEEKPAQRPPMSKKWYE